MHSTASSCSYWWYGKPQPVSYNGEQCRGQNQGNGTAALCPPWNFFHCKQGYKQLGIHTPLLYTRKIMCIRVSISFDGNLWVWIDDLIIQNSTTTGINFSLSRLWVAVLWLQLIFLPLVSCILPSHFFKTSASMDAGFSGAMSTKLSVLSSWQLLRSLAWTPEETERRLILVAAMWVLNTIDQPNYCKPNLIALA